MLLAFVDYDGVNIPYGPFLGIHKNPQNLMTGFHCLIRVNSRSPLVMMLHVLEADKACKSKRKWVAICTLKDRYEIRQHVKEIRT